MKYEGPVYLPTAPERFTIQEVIVNLFSGKGNEEQVELLAFYGAIPPVNGEFLKEFIFNERIFEILEIELKIRHNRTTIFEPGTRILTAFSQAVLYPLLDEVGQCFLETKFFHCREWRDMQLLKNRFCMYWNTESWRWQGLNP